MGARETDALKASGRVFTTPSTASAPTVAASTSTRGDIERGVGCGDGRGAGAASTGADGRGDGGRWTRALSALAAGACVAGAAFAVVSRTSAGTTATTMRGYAALSLASSPMGDDAFETRRMRDSGSFGGERVAGLGAWRRSRGGSLGDAGDDDPPFAAVDGYFAYESWFKSFEHGKFPGDSHRDETKAGETAIQRSDRHGTKSNVEWKSIRQRVAKSHGKKKVLLLLRHGEATHNVWGNTVDENLKVLPCSFNDKGDLLDPSLTARGIRQIMDARASLVGEHGLLRAALGPAGDGDDDEDDVDEERDTRELPVLSSPLLRTLETALLATSGARQATKPIVVTDYLRERLEMNAPFEIRHPMTVPSGNTEVASSFIASTHEKGCKFHEGLTQLFPDKTFKIHVAAQDECRADEIKPDSWKRCSHLGLTHRDDLELGDIPAETMLGVMGRVKVVVANVFDEYEDEDVVMLVTHSDWIVAALMELYPDTMGFVPRNGEIVPIVVQDMRKEKHENDKDDDDDEIDEGDDDDDDDDDAHEARLGVS